MRNALGGAALMAGGALIGIGAKSVQMAAQYQQSMTMIKDLTGSSTADMAKFDTGVKQLAQDSGKSTDELSQGLYQVISAGFKGGDAMKIMTNSAHDSVIGMTDMNTTTKALVVALGAYSLTAKDADNTSNEMLKTVSLGRMTMGDYASALSTGAAAAHANKVSMEAMNATIATLTAGGVKTAGVAMTDFTNLIGAMDTKTGMMAQRIHGLGLKFDENKFKTMDYTQQVAYLNEVMKGHEGMDAFVTGSKNAGQALQVLGTHMSMFKDDISQLSDKQKLAKDSAQSWADTQAGFAVSLQRFQQTLNVLMINIGSALLPVVQKMLDQLMSIGSGLQSSVMPAVNDFVAVLQSPEFSAFADSLEKLGMQIISVFVPSLGDAKSSASGFFGFIQNTALPTLSNLVNALTQTIKFLNDNRVAFEIVAGILLTLFIPAIIKSGVESTIASIKIGVEYVRSIIATGVEGWASAGKLITGLIPAFIKSGAEAVASGAKITVSFIGSMIKTGAEAVANAAKVTANFITSMVKAGTEAIAQGAKVVASFVAAMITTGAEAIANAAKITASFIASMIATGAQAIITGAQIVASFIAGLISAGAEAIVSAGIMLFTLVPALAAVALGVIAATWPFLLIAAVVAAVVVGIVLAIQHWGQISHWLQSVWAAFAGWFSGMISGVAISVGRVVGYIGSVLGNLGHKALGWAHDMIQGFVNGILGGVGAIGNAVSQVASTIASHLHFSKPDIGPLVNADTWMNDFTSLLADGLNKNLGKVKSASLNVSSTIANSAHPSSFAAASGGLGGMQVVPSNVSNPQGPIHITVMPANVTLDGRILTSGLMPHVVDQIRHATGTRVY